MNFAKTFSAQTIGLGAKIIDVEVDLSKGLHSFTIVGLPDKGVEESRDRVSASIKNSGFTSPKSLNQKVVVSLAPADIKKEGPIFDVAISLGKAGVLVMPIICLGVRKHGAGNAPFPTAQWNTGLMTGGMYWFQML